MTISTTDPIGAAIRRAKYITFQPFDLKKWFVMGFIAFLATLGDSGGGFGGGSGGHDGGGPATDQGRQAMHDAFQWIGHHITEVVLIGIAALVVVLGIWLLILWIGSRGRFMFMEAVANNTCEVRDSWRRFRYLGNSYTGFRVCLTLIWGTVFLAGLMVGVLLSMPDIRAGRFGGAAVLGILVGLGMIVPISILGALINWCTDNFVVVIMYARNFLVLDAWREFREQVLRGHVGTFFVFLLLQIGLSIGVGVLTLLIGCGTCCVGFLPYISSVITLPLKVFSQVLPMYFLQQFDPAYAIIREPVAPEQVPPMAFPQG